MSSVRKMLPFPKMLFRILRASFVMLLLAFVHAPASADTNLTEDQIKSGNMGMIYGGAFAFSLLASWTLAHTFSSYGQDFSVMVKVMTAFGVALGFIVPAIGTNYLFSQKGKALFLIDAAYWLLFYIAMGLVHAYLP